MALAEDVSYLNSLKAHLSKIGSSQHKTQWYTDGYNSGFFNIRQSVRLIYQLTPTATAISDDRGLTATSEVICARPIITSTHALEKSLTAYNLCISGGFIRINGVHDANFGKGLAIGDIDGDGNQDVIIGANNAVGAVYAFYNIATGLSSPSTVSAASVAITGGPSTDIGDFVTTGDLNGDGIVDFVSGGTGGGDNVEGRVYVFYGKSEFDSALTSSDADITITGSSNFDYIGKAGITGDLNGDGIVDLAFSSTTTAEVHVFYSTTLTNHATGIMTSDDADVIITGAAGKLFGRSMGAGDVIGDSRVDLLIGSHADGALGEGVVYIFDGSTLAATMTTANAGTTITGAAVNDFFGYSIGIGDVVGGNEIDVLIGASQAGSSDEGAVYIFDGSTLAVTMTAANAYTTITGITGGDQFGVAVDVADVNGDGNKDVIVGAFSVSPGGAAYVFYGPTFPVTAATASVTIATSGVDFNSFGGEVSVGDFDKDGKDDFAVADGDDDGNIVIILLGAGLADFASAGSVTIDVGA